MVHRVFERRSQRCQGNGRRALALFWVAVVFGGCASSGVVLSNSKDAEQHLENEDLATSTPMALGPGDKLEIHVFDEEGLSGTHRVSSEGTINVPLIGTVSVVGETPKMLAEQITNKLKRFVREPYVSVLVDEFKSKKIYVFGQVRKPGTFAFDEGMNIVHAITLAGGFDKAANRNQVLVTRKKEGVEERVQVPVQTIGEGKAANFILRPGDVIFVPESIF